MTVDYYSPCKVISPMIDYIGKLLDNIPEDMKGESATPVANHLFDIAEYATKLSQADAYKRGSKCMYAEAKKAIYGTL